MLPEKDSGQTVTDTDDNRPEQIRSSGEDDA